jgi:hypothetical protein
MAVKLLVESKIDAIFHSSSFGYRPNKSAKQTAAQARRNCRRYGWVNKKRQKGTLRFDARNALARWAGVDLTRINGLFAAPVTASWAPAWTSRAPIPRWLTSLPA